MIIQDSNVIEKQMYSVLEYEISQFGGFRIFSISEAEYLGHSLSSKLDTMQKKAVVCWGMNKYEMDSNEHLHPLVVLIV